MTKTRDMPQTQSSGVGLKFTTRNIHKTIFSGIGASEKSAVTLRDAKVYPSSSNPSRDPLNVKLVFKDGCHMQPLSLEVLIAFSTLKKKQKLLSV